MTTATFDLILTNKISIPKIENVNNLRSQETKNKKEKINIAISEINKLAFGVENNWEDFSKSKKEELKKFAYRVIEPEEISIFQRLHYGLFWLQIYLLGERKQYLRFCKAMDTLVDNILNAVECSDPNFQDSIMVEVNKIMENPDLGEIVNRNNISDKLRELRDQAFS